MEENKCKNKNKVFKIVISVLIGVNLMLTSLLMGLEISNIYKSNLIGETTKYTLYIGTNDKDTYKEEIPFETCLEKVTEICIKYTYGSTIFEATGYWKDDNNKITTERTIGCILEDIEKPIVYSICDELIVALNQNTILIETNQVSTVYYSGNK